MSKELEEIKSIVAIHFAALGFLNPIENEQILKDRDRVLNALNELQSIKESNPSEALELVEELDNCLISDMRIEVDDYDESNYCMSYEYVDFNGEGLQFNDDIKEETIIDFIREKKISTIKQALLKAQEPKKDYLKWENLEFKEKAIYKRATLNGELYLLKTYRNFILGFDIVELEKTDGTILFHINQYNLQFFNDLHLERVEE